MKRILLFTATLLFAHSLLAAGPSARTGARAAFNEETQTAILFGGLSEFDAATAAAYDLAETWEWEGTRWIHRYPDHVPPARNSQVMVYDPSRDQIVMFGGTTSTAGELGDTWVLEWPRSEPPPNAVGRRRSIVAAPLPTSEARPDWRQVETSESPSGRASAGAAFDPTRERVVLYGGIHLSEDKKSTVYLSDMWEFDGENWTRVMESGPAIRKPHLVFDEKREQLLLLGFDENIVMHMYAYDAGARTWNRIERENIPCTNEAGVVYSRTLEKVLLVGGVCIPLDTSKSSPSFEELWAWDGENWSKIETETVLARAMNQAVIYDDVRNNMVMFGGTFAYSTDYRNDTYVLEENKWRGVNDQSSPGGRSLFGMAADPIRNVIWLLGGITDESFFNDFWKFEDGFWRRVEAEGTPTCVSPLTAFDSDRAKLIALCSDSATYEWDGERWTEFKELKTKPTNRRFASLVYDPTLRKTILFGGYDINAVYQNKTWTWDGTQWTELAKKNRPPSRGLTSMWYDPTLKRVVFFGGVGRRDPNGRVERYDDMWSFDGTRWNEIKPATRPTSRYGAPVGVDPLTNKVVLHSGLRFDVVDNKQKQTYATDTWEWDGTTWRELYAAAPLGPRENAAMAHHPDWGLLLFGGWSGYYHSDTWRFVDGEWIVMKE